MQWLYNQSRLGADIGILRRRVGWFRRMLHVKIHHKNVKFIARIKGWKYEFTI
jgi:hypothetical protein